MRKQVLQRFYYGTIIRDSTFDFLRQPVPKAAQVAASRVSHCVSGKDDQELLLVGTMNLSTKFAFDTKKLLEEYKPTSVFLMAPTYFESCAYKIPRICTVNEEFQEELDKAGYHQRVLDEQNATIGWDPSSLIFRYKHFMLRWFLRGVFGWPANWQDVLHPGLEAYHVLQYARQNNIPVVFHGEEFGLKTLQRLMQQKKIEVVKDFWRYLNINEMWYHEAHDLHIMMLQHSLKELSEVHFDRDAASWFVRFGKVLSENAIETIVDERDESMFTTIDKQMAGSRRFALLNLWHMDGVENFWRNHKNCQFSSNKVPALEGAPVGEIKAYMEGADKDMKRVEATTKNTRAAHSRTLTAFEDVTRSHYA